MVSFGTSHWWHSVPGEHASLSPSCLLSSIATHLQLNVLLPGLDLHSRGDVECLALSKHTNPRTRGALKRNLLLPRLH